MGRKHSKNAGVMGSEALTYHERRALGYGTTKERLGKDAVGNYYDCRLTLSPAVDPVACPSGFLFSREAIIENLLEQRKEFKRRLAAWEASKEEASIKEAERRAIEEEAALLAFDRRNRAGASDQLATQLRKAVTEGAEQLLSDKQVTSGAINIRENESRIAEMRAFWLPSQTPEAAATVKKPDTSTRCPASGKKLKLKDLIDVKFTRLPGGGAHEYMDPLTRDPFTNASRLVVIKTTGDVVEEATWKKCILADGSWQGKPVTADDALRLQSGGTGFAEHDGAAAQSSKYFDLGPGSGLADRRGQSAGGSSKFGLRFLN
jgi:nitric oxide synthase-interacting protein